MSAADAADRVLPWLESWFDHGHARWQDLGTSPTGDPLGCWGSGWPGWGTQTAVKHASAATVVAARTTDPARRDLSLTQALSGVRYALGSHVAGDGPATTAGTRWGRTWISSLVLERAGFAFDLLGPHLTPHDRELLAAVRADEADWLLTGYERNGHRGVQADRWNDSGRNAPESNLWNGCALWRAAVTAPAGEDRAAAWKAGAVEFLVNGVSTQADRTSEEVLDGRWVQGRTVGQLWRGANFFDSFALDHHGYLNTGYATVCVSQAAYLWFDLTAAGLPVPESLHHHQADLWEVLRLCVTQGGRLVRLGGDHRVRYAYCQDYLVPATLYAERFLGDRGAGQLLAGHLDLVQRDLEQDDGRSFLRGRLERLGAVPATYVDRLEADRAATLSFLLAYETPPTRPSEHSPEHVLDDGPVRTSWHDLDHGFAHVRGPDRTAGFSWRANGGTNGVCFPSRRDDLADWELGLSVHARFEGDEQTADGLPSRRVLDRWISTFEGGFATCGTVSEGDRLVVREGFTGQRAATSYTAVVALPDDATVIGLHRLVAGDWAGQSTSAHGLNVVVPRDVHAAFRRRYAGSERTVELFRQAPDRGLEPVVLGSEVVVDGVLAVRSLDDEPVELLPDGVSGAALPSLVVDRLALGRRGPALLRPHQEVFDVAWSLQVVAPGPTTTATQVLAREPGRLHLLVTTRVGEFTVTVNLHDQEWLCPTNASGSAVDLSTGVAASPVVAAHRVRVVAR